MSQQVVVPVPRPSNIYFGHFATMSRLISTMVSEDMMRAYFVHNLQVDTDMVNGPYGRRVMGFCFLTDLPYDREVPELQLQSIYALAALRAVPRLNTDNYITINGLRYHAIDLLHPWDILPYVYGPSDNVFSFQFPDAPQLDPSFLHGAGHVLDKARQTIGAMRAPRDSLIELREGYDSIRLWRRYAYQYGVPARAADMCASWLIKSSQVQTYIYDHPFPLPTLTTTSVHWEHCVMEGHPLFPISRTIQSIPPVRPLTPGTLTRLLRETKIRLIAVPRANMRMLGQFEAKTRILVDRILERNGNVKELRQRYQTFVLLPVHHLQIPNIREKIPDAEILPEQNHVVGYALSSIRTVCAPGVVDGQTLKFSLGIELASIMRTIPPVSAIYGYRFSTEVVPRMSYDPQILTIQRETACAFFRDRNPEVAKHLCCILRDSEEIRTTSTIEGFAVCASLVEKIQRPDTTETIVRHAWNLDTPQKRTQFLDSYINLFFRAIIPPCRDNGIAFECHAQNTILRFNRNDGTLRGFSIRDLCDMQVHRETAIRSMGPRVAGVFPQQGYNYAETLEQAYIFLYYGAIYIHLQTLIRVLDMHYDGTGWAIARRRFMELVQPEHEMFDFFMRRDQVPIRSYTRTRLMNTTTNNAFFENLLKPNLLLIGMRDHERTASEANRIRQAQVSSSRTLLEQLWTAPPQEYRPVPMDTEEAEEDYSWTVAQQLAFEQEPSEAASSSRRPARSSCSKGKGRATKRQKTSQASSSQASSSRTESSSQASALQSAATTESTPEALVLQLVGTTEPVPEASAPQSAATPESAPEAPAPQSAVAMEPAPETPAPQPVAVTEPAPQPTDPILRRSSRSRRSTTRYS